jgi:hypothetical protein
MKLTDIQRRILHCMRSNGAMPFGAATIRTWRRLQRHELVWWRAGRFRLTKKGRTVSLGRKWDALEAMQGAKS